MRLAEPAWLILLTLVPLPWLLGRTRSRIAWPTLDGFEGIGHGRARLKGALPAMLRGLAMAFIAIALARPQTVGGRTRVAGQGVAIVVAIDQSSSMNTADFPSASDAAPLSRLEAARRTVSRFVLGRSDDLVGLVVFANFPDLASPPTLDHAFVLDAIRALRPARPGDDGTNLGDAIVWSVEALADAKPRKKVLILLTDGHNSPAVPHPTDPLKAAAIARALGINLHTIAVGGEGKLKETVEPATKPAKEGEVEGPDLELLRTLAKAGGGQSFVASDTRALDDVFKTIDALEKSPVRGEVRTRYREEYAPWVAGAFVMLALDRLFSAGWFRRLT